MAASTAGRVRLNAAVTGWHVIGVDPSFSRYLVYDERDNYACFDDDGHLRYYHTSSIDPDPAATRARFHRLLHRLRPILMGDIGEVVRWSTTGAPGTQPATTIQPGSHPR